MTIEATIRSVLMEDTTVKGITTRCYPVMIPQSPTYPLILYARISGVRDHHLQGPSGLVRTRLQIEAWAETYAGAKTLATAIRGALDGYTDLTNGVGSCLLDNERDIYEPELSIYRVVHDYLIIDEE
jgi:hypothetical protein